MSVPTQFKACPVCGTAHYLNASYCPNCGHTFTTQFPSYPPPNQAYPPPTQAFTPPSQAYPPPPGQAYPPPTQAFQPYQVQPQSYAAPKSKVLAIVLALFLGSLGIHRFYLGHNNTAIAMLCLWIAGLATMCLSVGYILLIAASIWALVDVVMIATDSLGDASGRPLTN